MDNNQKGFGHTGLIMLISVVGIIGLVGWFVPDSRTVIHNAPAKKSTLKAPNPQPQPVDNLHVASLPNISISGWQSFQESSGKISYKYPSDWTFKNSGLIYYGPSEATSNNKSSIQTLTSPDGEAKADWGNNFKKLSGAQITIRVIDDHSNTSQEPSDYCQQQPNLTLEKLDNSATPLCVKMSYIPESYDMGASYCTLFLHAEIILGGKNTIEQNQKYLQVLVGIGNNWRFMDVCTTDSRNVEHLYFGP